jgi:hypothetical protein
MRRPRSCPPSKLSIGRACVCESDHHIDWRRLEPGLLEKRSHSCKQLSRGTCIAGTVVIERLTGF